MDTNSLKAFALIIEEGSFSAAARRLGISKSMCSKYISDLEDNLGARLLTRSTRSVRTTTIGEEYYQKIRHILDLLDDANEHTKAESGTITGCLRIGLPASYSLLALQPYILKFMERYPGIKLESILEDSKSDLISESFDALIRIGELEDSTMIARRIHSLKAMIVASPAYLSQHGTPLHPSQLADHKVLHCVNISSSATWPFQEGNKAFWQKVDPRFASNNVEIIRTAALAGHGIAYLPELLIRDELEAGTLTPILTEFARPDVPVSIVYPSRKNISTSLKAFLEFAQG